MKLTIAVALFGAAAAFAPVPAVHGIKARTVTFSEEPKKGAGGMADTRDPEPFVNEDDPRQSISTAPSFEEYLKSRSNQ
eukprot:CAMPEP_0197285302 /NCGR_PEP_ID=MMETSP0890-20130614/522_1 /TAXON_ID=44058 ORGANISM="Aureoumbra lagunensis, Strain CCMP1510" /NCGR_SAMPLE_ID=MMETSP0890 /ASSEMBLY_ACC=CAM_ASM_000533 /LENGTH=78 /DNA_ID=CAMNT_0042752653 /DNA_START=63 /DNA_END=299 /DNA_ORIENTATION=-